MEPNGTTNLANLAAEVCLNLISPAHTDNKKGGDVLSEQQSKPAISTAQPAASSMTGIAREPIAVAKALEYLDWELSEAVDASGLPDTLGFLRREAAARAIPLRLM